MEKFNLPTLTNVLTNGLRQQLQGLTIIYKSLQIIVGAILPILEGFLASKASADEPSRFIISLLIAIASVHALLLFLLVSNEKPLAQFLVEFDEQEKELDNREKSIELLDIFSDTFRNALTSSFLSLAGIDTIINGQKQELQEIFRDILDPWIQSRTNIFWFYNGDALYNIAVYLFNSQENVLEVCFRQCDDRILTKNRQWSPGIGHIGLCYAKGETVFCEDITIALQTTNSRVERPEDKEYYKSVVAEPIKVGNQIRGVFIVTSSQSEQFDEDIHVLCVRVIAQLLGLGYQLTQVTKEGIVQ